MYNGPCEVCGVQTCHYLSCEHIQCMPCLLNISNGSEVVCKTCQKVSSIESLLMILYKCSRCGVLGDNIHLCGTCDNYLCTTCWELIHSFYPLNQHIKATKNPQHKINVLDKFKLARTTQEQVVKTMSELIDSETSVQQQHINRIKERFNQLHQQLYEQETQITAYIHNLSDIKFHQCDEINKELISFTQKCNEILFDKFAVLETPIPSFSEDLDFNMTIDEDYVIPEIVSITIAHPEPILITQSGILVPPVTGRATVVCMGGGAAGGTGWSQFQGGGGSGFIRIEEKDLHKDESIDVIIGAGGKASIARDMPSENGHATQFGDIIAQGGYAPSSMDGGNGGSGGGAGIGLSGSQGGTGGTGGSEGGSTIGEKIGDAVLNFQGGTGHNSVEYEKLRQWNILPGAGGRGGKKTPDGFPAGGGAGGLVFKNNSIHAKDGFGPEENNGLGGEGYGAGGGGGSSYQIHASSYVSKMGGNGAPGCVIIIYH